jgi:PAS domain S-box-containing protein
VSAIPAPSSSVSRCGDGIMNTPPSARHQGSRRRAVYAGSILISLAVITLLVAAFLPRLYGRPFSSLLLTLVLIALAAAIALHARFLILARREQRETASALSTAEHEFQAIFDSALDSLLILDDQGRCLEANPAAVALFGAKRDELIGQAIGHFQRASPELQGEERMSLCRNDGQGEMQIARLDGRSIFVEYSLKTNYLPGRHSVALRDISGRKHAETALRESDERFQQMADNILETFWMLDSRTKEVVYVNQAFEALTGRTCDSLRAYPTSYQELFHPQDRVHVLTRLEEAVATGQFDEEFRIIRPDHAIRWIWVRGFPVRDTSGAVHRLVGTAQDITARKSAEEQMATNLRLAESARAEADALRKTTLALKQNLSMDYVLDTLLESLLNLIPCDSVQVLLAETEDRLFLARERRARPAARQPQKPTTTWNATDHPPLMQVLITRNILLVQNTAEQEGWGRFKGYSHFHSWLGVPLIASQEVLGLLCLGDSKAYLFKQEHLRLAKSLAIPAAVAIQNARLYERAEIYGAELEKQLAGLEQTQRALQEAEESRALSEEKFTKVFRASPIAFSITTVDEGRFIDVNEAFERRYGYSRDHLIGRTILDVGIWDDPEERPRMLAEIREHGSTRNHVTHLRTHSGEVVEAVLSAQVLELEGQKCILAVTEEPTDGVPLQPPLTHRAGVGG